MLKPSTIVGSAFLLLSIVGLSDPCSPQGGVTWQRVHAGIPPANNSHAMAYDAARQRVVLFGPDTWEWDGVSWTQATPAQSPSRRSGHAMAYDAARQRVVLFGGLGFPALQDTWEWDGANWTQATPAQSPSARWDHAMAYDAARERVVLFGPDTWEWDGVNWIHAAPAHPSPPFHHAMAYDAARQRVVLFGGLGPPGFQDTWLWDGVNWTRAMPAQSPPARSDHAMAYDAARQRVVLFGGVLLSGGYPVSQDTWEWDGVDWTQATPAQGPSARNDHAMAYDATRQRMVLFGGSDGMSSLSDTWECHSLSPALFTSFGTGCPGSLGVPSLGTTPFSSPWTGDTFSIDVTNLSFGAMSFMVTGLSNTFWAGALIPLPAPLMSWGMPGCTAYTDVVNSELLVNTTGTATWSTTIPNNANLIGLTFYNQGFIIEPGVNALGAIVSNAGEAVVGMR